MFRALLDSGANACPIKRSALLKGITLKELSNKKSFVTLRSTFSAKLMVTLQDVRSPGFDTKRHIEQQRALVFDSETCRYDIILALPISHAKLELIWL